jgi:hypothetical protein
VQCSRKPPIYYPMPNYRYQPEPRSSRRAGGCRAAAKRPRRRLQLKSTCTSTTSVMFMHLLNFMHCMS